MKKQTKTNHTHLKDSGHTSGKHSALSGASAGRPDKNIQKDIEKAHKDIVHWLKSPCPTCINIGYNKCLAEVEKIINIDYFIDLLEEIRKLRTIDENLVLNTCDYIFIDKKIIDLKRIKNKLEKLKEMKK